MRQWIGVLALAAAAAMPAAGQGGLETVLDRMAAAGDQFRSLQADVERTKVTVIVNDHAVSSGRIYFTGQGEDSRIRMSITDPAPQELLVREGRAELYTPRTNQVQVWDLGEREDLAEYLVIGFGPANRTLEENYTIELVGEEALDGRETTVLELVPRAERVRALFSSIVLWVEPERWIPIQQRLNESGGDYQLVRYSDIELNGEIPDSTFELDLPDDVQVIEMR